MKKKTNQAKELRDNAMALQSSILAGKVAPLVANAAASQGRLVLQAVKTEIAVRREARMKGRPSDLLAFIGQ